VKNSLVSYDFTQTRFARFTLLAIVALVFLLHPTALLASPTITYVQGNYATPQSPSATVSVTFTAAQVAGDLNVVVVGWNDSSATVSKVTDKSGNQYERAVGPTVQSGYGSQSIYYARSIVAAAAGSNSVTVTFSAAAVYPDIRILEYRGADLSNPVDVTAASSGNSAASSSGSLTTTSATDLLFAANLVRSTTTGPGAGFTDRLLTQPDGDIAEDRMVTSTGSYGATAPLSSAPWIMQLVAFRTASGDTTPPTAPHTLTATAASVSQIHLTWSPSTDNIAVTGYLVGRCQGAGCTTFAKIATISATAYTNIGLLAGTSYSYRVQATDAAGNLSSYSNVVSATTATTAVAAPPTITSAISASGTAGTAFHYQITASNAPTSYAAAGLTAGLTINAATGLISGTPTSAGTSTVRLSATNASGTGNATLTLTVLAPGPLVITPGSTNFSNVTLGSSSTQSVLMNNPGAGSITISQADIAGKEFSISGLSLPLVLSAGQSRTFSVAFTPSSAGAVDGSLSFLSTATNSPTVEDLSGTGIHVVYLNWQASTSVVVGYNVYRGVVSGGPYTKLNSSSVSGTTYFDTSVQAGQKYYYVVTAVNSNNHESGYSDQASAVVPAP
jgi:fibronectin type 3 domain-containing protein